MRTLPLLLLCGLLAGCGSTAPAPATGPATGAHPTAARSIPASPAAPVTRRPAAGSVPPAWLGTRVLPRTASGYGEIRPTPRSLQNRRFTLPDTLPMLPGNGFRSMVEPAPAAVLARSTWTPACPVRATDLAWVRLAFWGFDHRRHTGELLVNRSAAAGLVTVFHELYAERFPIEQMTITSKAEQLLPPTGDGNNSGSFNCRPAVGSTHYSEHAYGLAVDLDPFQNPYVKGDLVLPELASSYLDRRRVRPGMILPNDPVVRAFARIGWTWGGTWRNLKDLQHFSANGR